MKTLFIGQNQHGFKVVMYLEDVLAITFKDHRAEVQLIHSAGVDLSVESAERLLTLLESTATDVQSNIDSDSDWVHDLTEGDRVFNSVSDKIETVKFVNFLKPGSSKRLIHTYESSEGLEGHLCLPVMNFTD